VVTTLGQAALVSFRKTDSSLDPKQAAKAKLLSSAAARGKRADVG
jgi:hypothetical protein